MLLQKETVPENCKKKLKYFFENNLNKGTEVRMVWDTSNALVKGYFIQCK